MRPVVSIPVRDTAETEAKGSDLKETENTYWVVRKVLAD